MRRAIWKLKKPDLLPVVAVLGNGCFQYLILFWSPRVMLMIGTKDMLPSLGAFCLEIIRDQLSHKQYVVERLTVCVPRLHDLGDSRPPISKL